MKVYCYNSINKEINLLSVENLNYDEYCNIYNKCCMISDIDFIIYSDNLDNLYNKIRLTYFCLHQIKSHRINKLLKKEKQLESEVNLIKNEIFKNKQEEEFVIKENF
jgi:hypothetical protein